MVTLRNLARGFLRLETAAVLIAVVTLLAVFGSLFPQVSPAIENNLAGTDSWRDLVRARYGGWANLLLALGAFRFALSPLFLIPLGLLVVAAVVCALRRWPAVARIGIGRIADELSWLPPLEERERMTMRMISLGFPWLSFGLLSGSIWAQQAWGRYWVGPKRDLGVDLVALVLVVASHCALAALARAASRLADSGRLWIDFIYFCWGAALGRSSPPQHTA